MDSPIEVLRDGAPSPRPVGAIVAYRVDPVDGGDAAFHVLTFENGVEVQIYTERPILLVQPEVQ